MSLTNEVQIQYVIKWFQEFSEMQREDFLNVLLESHNSTGVNGLVTGLDDLNCAEDSNKKPPSLFQCRVKLFREWSQNWSQPEKDSVVASIKNLDPKFGEQYEERLSDG